MTTACRDLECALRVHLSAHIGEVELLVGRGERRRRLGRRRRANLSVQCRDSVAERRGAQYREPIHRDGLRVVARRDEQSTHSTLPAYQRDGEHTPNRLNAAVERELAHDGDRRSAAVAHAARGREDA